MPADLIIERISGATIGFSNLPLTRIVVYASRNGDIYVFEIVILNSQWQTQIGFESSRVVNIMHCTRITLFINVLTINFFETRRAALLREWLIVSMWGAEEKYCNFDWKNIVQMRDVYRTANRKNQLTNVDSPE